MSAPLLLALYEPDIAQNAGAMMRTCACLGVDAAIIEPAGFRSPIADSAARAWITLMPLALERHVSFGRVRDLARVGRRRARAADHEGRIAVSGISRSGPATSCWSGANWRACRTLSQRSADARVRIPIRPPLRSLNVGIAAALALGEALRQLR